MPNSVMNGSSRSKRYAAGLLQPYNSACCLAHSSPAMLSQISCCRVFCRTSGTLIMMCASSVGQADQCGLPTPQTVHDVRRFAYLLFSHCFERVSAPAIRADCGTRELGCVTVGLHGRPIELCERFWRL